MPAPPGAGRGTARANPASYHRQIADRNAQAILDAAEELLRLEGLLVRQALVARYCVVPS